ncbi:MAG: transposase [Proteobacteria bacterium]|nr:transposase [Pseudomonadota bacterium]MBU1389747.1 transposase [Pseudomonadota bacterium]MBU1543756.1 transposase [Pseudomonadota bacterium]MBU2482820.1 transposase [Pseudomonadota bacterium]
MEVLLKKYYQPGRMNKGERAYSPLLLFKCMLLQKWFQIKSDPELESQVNDRLEEIKKHAPLIMLSASNSFLSLSIEIFQSYC